MTLCTANVDTIWKYVHETKIKWYLHAKTHQKSPNSTKLELCFIMESMIERFYAERVIWAKMLTNLKVKQNPALTHAGHITLYFSLKHYWITEHNCANASSLIDHIGSPRGVRVSDSLQYSHRSNIAFTKATSDVSLETTPCWHGNVRCVTCTVDNLYLWEIRAISWRLLKLQRH